jgi:hypothetical protein
MEGSLLESIAKEGAEAAEERMADSLTKVEIILSLKLRSSTF